MEREMSAIVEGDFEIRARRERYAAAVKPFVDQKVKILEAASPRYIIGASGDFTVEYPAETQAVLDQLDRLIESVHP
jgi:hypothetical protein